jgi:hypothetical protein
MPTTQQSSHNLDDIVLWPDGTWVRARELDHNDHACMSGGYRVIARNSITQPDMPGADFSAMAIRISSGFTPVEQVVPSDDKPVLAVREANHAGAHFEVITARYMPDYRPLSPWRDLGLDSVHDSGESVLGWMAMPSWLTPEG